MHPILDAGDVGSESRGHKCRIVQRKGADDASVLAQGSLDCTRLGDAAPDPDTAGPAGDDIHQAEQELVACDRGDRVVKRDVVRDQLVDVGILTDLLKNSTAAIRSARR